MKLILLLVLSVLTISINAQIRPYCFSQATVAYAAITGGSSIGSITDDDESYQALPIGFTFNFKGTNFTQFCANSNGYITLGAIDNGPSYSPISGPADDNVIAVLGADLAAQAGATLRYQTTGAAPNRILTIQWLNYTPYGEIANMSFQIRLLETSNIIQFNYGTFTIPAALNAFAEVGLRGSMLNESDLNNVEVVSGTNTWATPVILSATSFSLCELLGTAFIPASGLRYIWTPSTLTNVATPPAFCPPSTVSLSATASSGTINWYADPTTPTVAGTGPSFITPLLAASDTFYVAMNGCVSQRVPVIINPASPIASAYAFTQNSSTYTAVTGGTVLGTITNDEETFENLPIGFNFAFNGTTFTNFSVATNGYIGMGAVLVGNIQPISAVYEDNLISVLGGDLAGQAGSSLRYVLSGVAPNRVLTVQWQNYGYYNETGLTYNAQIKLFETSNVIQVIYGAVTQTAGISFVFDVGISGNSLDATDFSGRSIVQGTNLWATSANALDRFTSTGEINNNAFKPASGQRYIWTPYQFTTTTPATICAGNTATISATPSAGTVNWFAAPIGGGSLGSGNTFLTPALSSTTTYYAQLTGGSCAISPRTAVVVTVNPGPTSTITAAGPTTFCSGGSVVLNANTGAGLSYQWRLNGTNIGGATNASLTVIAAGSYTVIVTQAGCSTTSAATVVTVSPSPTITLGTVTNPTSCGGTNGSIQVTGSGTGVVSWTGTASGSSGSVTLPFTIPTLAAGTYAIQFTVSGCVSNTLNSTLTNPGGPLATITAAGPTTFCAAGSVVLNANTGGGLTYQWRLNGTNILGATTASLTVTSAGSYTVIVTQAGCSTTSSTTVVTVNPSPTIALGTITNPTSCGGTNGSIQVTGSGTGVVSWTGTASGSSGSVTLPFTIPTLAAGTYAIQFTVSGCLSNTLNSTLTNPGGPVANITAAGPTTFCAGGSVVLNANTGGGLTYQWRLNGTNIAGATTASLTVTASGSYTVIVTQAGCSTTSAATIVTVNPLPTATITAGGLTTFCAGGSVVLNANTGAGLSYQWRLNGTNIVGATSAFLTVTASGSYTVIVTQTACSATSAATVVTVNPSPTITLGTVTNPTSCGGTNGSIQVTGSGTGVVSWTGTASGSSGSVTLPFTIPTLASGTYAIQFTVSGCASNTLNSTLTSPGGPASTITAAGPTTFCAGGSVVLNANTGGGLTYQWRLNGTNISGATTASLTVTTSGSYTLVVTQAGCPTTSVATVVTVNPLPTASITAAGPTTFCAGASVTLNANTGGGLSYQWRLNGTNISGATSAFLAVTASGSYTVIVTQTGCSTTSAATVVTVNALPIATITPSGSTTFCLGGSVTLTSSTGTSYLWSTGATTASINVTTSSPPTVTVTNVAGCQSLPSAAATVTVNALPSAPIITPSGSTTFCSGGTATLTSSTGTSYLWSTGATSSSINVTTSSAPTVQVTNAAGCQSLPSAATTVTVNALPSAPTISAGGATTFCAGGSVTLTSSTGTSYLWSTGATSSSINVTTSSAPTVQVTNAAGCQSLPSAATTVTVNALPSAPTISAGGPTTLCAGGSVTLTSSTGTSYLWSTGATSASISVTTSSAPTVQVINAFGCQSLSSAITTVTVNAIPSTPIITPSGPTTFCSGGSVTLTSSTGTSYLWSTGESTQAIIVSSTDLIDVAVIDVFGCQSAASALTSVAVGDFTAPDPIILLDISTECSITPPTPTTTDDCAGTISGTTTTVFPIATQGLTIMTWIFDDGNGNITFVDQNIIIEDLTAPDPDVATLPVVNEVCLVTSLTEPTATDNCSATVTVTNDVILPITQVGTTVVTWSYEDENGNISTQTQDVVIAPIVATTTTLNNVITSNTADQYQWIDCASNQAIAGETAQSFAPTVNGSYAVVNTEGACSDTSDCVVINSIGLDEISLVNAVNIYPNPTREEIVIEFSAIKAQVQILDAQGKLLKVIVAASGDKVSLFEYENGVYFFRVITDLEISIHQIVKN